MDAKTDILVSSESAEKKSTCFVAPSPAHSTTGDPVPLPRQRPSNVTSEHDHTSIRRLSLDSVTRFRPFTRLLHMNLRSRIVERRRADEDKRDHEMDDAKLLDGRLIVDDTSAIVEDKKLSEGKVLQKMVAKCFPKHLLGTPVEDIDPYFREYEETFMVISRRFHKFGYILRFSATPALNLFPPWHPLRKVALYTYSHPLFDLIVIFTILANSLFMAMNAEESVPEYTFLALYTFEAIVKAIARGLILAKHTYLRDPWNWLDFVVLVSAYATIIAQIAAGGSSVNIQALRTFRVFRVLKTVAVIPGLKRIIEALMRALRMLGDVYLVTIFFFTIFALFGVEIFMGSLKTKCVLDPSSVGFSVNPNDTNYVPWLEWIGNSSNWCMRDDAWDYEVCGNASGAVQCRANYTCLTVDHSPNPEADFTHYDNFYGSFMAAIEIFNTDYWDYLYNSVFSSNGYAALIWFIFCVVLLSYYLSNLFQAVVALSYQVEDEEDEEGAADGIGPDDKTNQKKMRFAFDPFKLRRFAKDDTATVRSRSLMSLKTVTKRKIAERKASLPPLKPSEPEVATVDANGKPVAVVRPQIATVDDATSDTTIPQQLNHDLTSNWPGFANLFRYRVTSRPPSAVPLGRLPEVGFWDRNPICCITCCIGYFPWLKVQHGLMIFVTDPFFELFITLAIVANTVSMSAYYNGIPDDANALLAEINDVCTYIFIIECFLKLMAMCGEYFENRWNWLDFAVVIGSVLDILFTEANLSFSGFNTSIIRLLRLLRILKLAKSWKTMRMLLEIIFGTIGAIGNLMLVLMIVIFIFAVIGMSLFSTSYNEHKFMPVGGQPSFTLTNGFQGIPEWNWVDFLHSFMNVFRVLCRETYQPMWDCMTANGAAICVPFYLAILMVGSYIVLNLFMAVLLNAFSSENINKRSRSVEDDRLKKRLKKIKIYIWQFLAKCFHRVERRIYPAAESPIPDDPASTDNATTVLPDDAQTVQSTEIRPNVKVKISADPHSRRGYTPTTRGTTPGPVKSTNSISGSDARMGFSTARSTRSGGSVAGFSAAGDLSDEDEIVKLHDCCWPAFNRKFRNLVKPFSMESRFGSIFHRGRAFCLRISEHKAFEYTILGFIFASSISLCLQDANLNEGSDMDVSLSYLDFSFLGVFTIEMLIKLFALGFRTYLTSFWTFLDFFIVATGYADLVMGELSSSANLQALRALRTLRALRPLRAISRWQGMRIVVNALIAAIPNVANVLLVVMIIWLIFAIMGVQFFAGKFSFCMEIATGNRIPRALVPNQQVCANNTEWAWATYLINFDNIGNAYLALLQVATFEGWTTILQYSVDSADSVGVQPAPENSINYYVYFVIFIVICSFFLLNLFVGVIIDGFNALKKKFEGHNTAMQLFMTDSQRQYYRTIRKLSSRKPRKTIARPQNRLGILIYDIANSSRFEASMSLVIALNVVVLATAHYNQAEMYTYMQDLFELFFTTIFVLETMLLLAAYRHYYFRSPWHIFDFIVVILTVLTYIVTDWLETIQMSPKVLHTVRLLRVSRVLRLIRASKGIRKLMFSFAVSLPALFNICCLLFLIIFIYAIIGMNLFGHVGHFSGNLDDIYNFHTLPNALLTLFRMTTTSGWDNVHQGLSFTDDPGSGCQSNVSLSDPRYVWSNPCCNRTFWRRPSGEIVQDKSGWGNCGNYSLASLYCVSFLLFTGFIVVNMFAAVILDNYQQAIEQEESGVTDDDIEHFYHTWENFDPLASQFIPLEDLSNFAAALEPPLCCPKPNDHALTILDIPIMLDTKTGQEMCHCLDVLIALIRKALGFLDETEEFVQVREHLESLFETAFPSRVEALRLSSTKFRKKQDIAAKKIQRAWRNYILSKDLKREKEKAIRLRSLRGRSDNSFSSSYYLQQFGGSRAESVVSSSLEQNMPSAVY